MNGRWTFWGLIAALFSILMGGVRAEAADWCQLGNGPQRQHYSAETISPPYKIKWTVPMTAIDVRHRVHGRAQVIAADGRVYIGAKSGVFFAFDAVTGSTVWQYQAGGGIVHTAGYENGLVFFAAMDGCIYALDASTGSEAWKYPTGRRFGFSGAVLLAEGKAFAIDRGGYLYALVQSTGARVWAEDYYVGAPVFQSPSYNNGKIFFGSEDMRVHAVNAADGAQVWRSNQVQGQNFTDYWPVVFNGEVIVRPMTGLEPRLGDGVNPIDPYNQPIRGITSLNENTGIELSYIPHHQVLTMSGATSPPAITKEGLLAIPWKTDPNPTAYWSAWGWGLLDLSARDVTRVLTGNTSAPDETMIASVFDNTLIVIHSGGCFWGNPHSQNGACDLVTGTWYKGSSGLGLPPDNAAYVHTNNQAEGANAVSGANGLLYHQTFDLVYCMERQ